MGNVFQFDWEVKLIVAVQDLIRSFPFLKEIFSFFTTIGEPAAVVLLVAVIYWGLDKKLGVRIALYMQVGMVTGFMFKNVFRRIRPYAANKEIECLKAAESRYDIYDMSKQGFSFPSGHATCSSRLLSILYKTTGNKKLLYIGSFVVLMICISRFALGVHYPTDVLGGLLLGILPILLLKKAEDKLEKKHFYPLLFAYSCLGFFFCTSNDYYSILGLMLGFMSGDLFEEKYVGFKNTDNVLRMIIRVLLGGIIFLAVTTVLKKPFPAEVLEALSLFAYLYRVFRYAAATFIVVGLYPVLFKYNILNLEEKDAG